MIRIMKDLVFSDKCLSHDHGNPLLTFQLHDQLQQSFGLDGTYAILRPRLLFWIQISALILIQAIVAIFLAIVIYNGIIKQRGSTFSYLLGWGFIVPFALAFPFYMIPFLDVQNRAVLVTFTATPTLVGFRCLEALYGFSPHSVEDSLWNYCIYYSSVIELVFDEKTRMPAPATRADVLTKGMTFVMNFVTSCLLLSFMEAHTYQPFKYEPGEGSDYLFSSNFIHPGRIGNNFLSAVSTSLTISTSTIAFGFAICAIFGIRTLDVFDNPMFGSSSVSDFWGRRWNRLVHGVLKRGVYKPVRKHSSSRTLAAVAAFVASGVLHEYILMLMSLSILADAGSPEKYTTFVPLYGNQFCFFAWNGMLMALEYIILRWSISSKVTLPNLPNLLRSMLVILMALPVAHWFTDEYVRSGFFAHYVVGFPIISRLE